MQFLIINSTHNIDIEKQRYFKEENLISKYAVVDCWFLESVNMIGKVLKLQPRLFIITYYCSFNYFCTKTMMNQMFMYFIYFVLGEILVGFY